MLKIIDVRLQVPFRSKHIVPFLTSISLSVRHDSVAHSASDLTHTLNPDRAVRGDTLSEISMASGMDMDSLRTRLAILFVFEDRRHVIPCL